MSEKKITFSNYEMLRKLQHVTFSSRAKYLGGTNLLKSKSLNSKRNRCLTNFKADRPIKDVNQVSAKK
jgi:hypothetical protein